MDSDVWKASQGAAGQSKLRNARRSLNVELPTPSSADGALSFFAITTGESGGPDLSYRPGSSIGQECIPQHRALPIHGDLFKHETCDAST